MDETTVQACFERFGLPSDASMHEIERSFRELRELYSKKSLAIYSLMGEEESEEKLQSLQAAYEQILQARLLAPSDDGGNNGPEVKPGNPLSESRVVVVDADPAETPGLFLQQMREARGLSLRNVAESTKIGTTYLESIEQHDFSRLPAPVYVRGFLKAFCRMLKVPDADLLVGRFMDLYEIDCN